MTNAAPETYTVTQLAARWQVKRDRVVALLKSGQLSGFDAATSPNAKRPSYRIFGSSVEAFELRRQVGRPKPAPRRRRRRKYDVEFIK